MNNEETVFLSLNERFEKFYNQVFYKSINIDGIEWRYMDIGNPNGKPLVFLTGGFRHALWSFSTLDLFLDEYRVLAPCYPLINDLDAVIDGIKFIIEHESIQNCYMIGSSWGGSMVQCFTYKYPEIADKIVLSNTGAIFSKLMIPVLKLHKKMLGLQSKEKVLSDYKKKALGFWSKPQIYQKFWANLIERFYTELFTYEDYVALIQNQIDYLERYAFKLIEKSAYKKPVLIISSKDETASTKKVRNKVKDLYEQQKYYEFDVGGHAVALAHPKEYKQLVQDFLNR